MTTIITDKSLERTLRRRRKQAGADRWDEVWEGVYVMAAMPNNQHQSVANTLLFSLELILGQTGRGRVFPGVNISDRPMHWKRNYRCPDVAVYLSTNNAEDRGTHWYGGPDLAVEIVSPGEDPHAKLDFYAKVGTRELLIIERDPWRIELFQLKEDTLELAGVSELSADAAGSVLASKIVPFTWQLVAGGQRPRMAIICTETGQTWHV